MLNNMMLTPLIGLNGSRGHFYHIASDFCPGIQDTGLLFTKTFRDPYGNSGELSQVAQNVSLCELTSCSHSHQCLLQVFQSSLDSNGEYTRCPHFYHCNIGKNTHFPRVPLYGSGIEVHHIVLDPSSRSFQRNGGTFYSTFIYKYFQYAHIYI